MMSTILSGRKRPTLAVVRKKECCGIGRGFRQGSVVLAPVLGKREDLGMQGPVKSGNNVGRRSPAVRHHVETQPCSG